jgi:hypothetical protein
MSSEVLDAAAADPASAAWDVIWQESCHQGTRDPASAVCCLGWRGPAPLSVATVLTYLFGRFSCPGCGTRFDMADYLAGVPYQ